MQANILNIIEKFSLIKKGDRITVALSGGADSMALLYALLSLKEKLGIELSAAHFNHLIRGEEALRDEEFVKAECEKLGVQLFLGKADVVAFAKENKMSLELAARHLRYEFLERVSPQLIATAHTASDNLETMIFNLSRGTAADGLTGIPVKRERFIRPLISSSRAEIEAYCEANNIKYVTDSTNLSDDYTRNKIRHNIVLILKEINPQVEKAALSAAFSIKEDSAYLDMKAQEYLCENKKDGALILEGLKTLDKAVAKRVIKRFLSEKIGGELLSVHIEAVFELIFKTGKISLPLFFTAVSDKEKLVLLSADETNETPDFKVEIIEKNSDFLKKWQNVNNLLLKNLIDCDKIVGELKVRTRKAGDKIRLLNRGCTKELRSIYTENKVPVNERENRPVICDDKGVVWVYEFGVAHRCAVSDKTQKAFLVESERS